MLVLMTEVALIPVPLGISRSPSGPQFFSPLNGDNTSSRAGSMTSPVPPAAGAMSLGWTLWDIDVIMCTGWGRVRGENVSHLLPAPDGA